jgi:pyridoxine kinase
MSQSVKPAVMAISSHAARGAIGNRSVVFALEAFGHSVWAVPTLVLPWHPGHGRATRIEPDSNQFASLLNDLQHSPFIGEVGAVITGYMANPAQVEEAAKLVAAVKAGNPAVTYLCDPVIGDHGGLYVPQAVAEAIRDFLLPLADITTPNIHELAWLTGEQSASTGEEAARMARKLPPPTVLVTSAPAMMRGFIGNLLVTGRSAILAEHRLVSGPTNGAGDLTAGLFLAHVLDGKQPHEALRLVSSSVFMVMAAAAATVANEISPQGDLTNLLRPIAPVQIRSLTSPVVKPK